MSNSGVVNIRGKEYQTVAKRVNDFRAAHADMLSIETELVSNADVVLMKASIKDKQGFTLSTGFAEEVRDSTNINKTSALENCETSAVGRALAFLGYGGSEIASANEVSDAIVAGAKKEVVDYMVLFMSVLRNNMNTVLSIREALLRNDLASAAREWFEDLTQDEQKILYLAPSKGGIFTTLEREQIKSKEFRVAYYGEDDGE